ncbi:MAG TPA: hypothetical protein VFD82_01015 [Planctomycetota bacterium]|nr:hypothetical protein [Planctomycetota bacterium]
MFQRKPTFVLALLTSIHAAAGLLAQDDKKPKPLPAGPDAYTQKRYQADKARFWRDLLLAECKAGEALRQEWQPQVEELMSLYAEMFCARIFGDDRSKRIADLCDRLQEAGCADPVVQLVIADVAFYRRKTDIARASYVEAQRLEGRSSARLRWLLHNALQIFWAAEKQDDARSKAAAARDDCLVELAASTEFGPGHERFLLDLVLGCWGGKVGPDDLALLERMEKKAGKPGYALLVLRGTYHNTMAWAARGQGPARSISEADGKRFGEQLQAGFEVLQQAHEMCPRHPEAPTLMVKTLGPGGGEPVELRRWFDRAVEAQFDWREAYLSYMHYMQPRWGGSPRALFDFGKECLATARFDTEVPGHLRVAIHYVTLGTTDAKAVWADESVQQLLAELDQRAMAAVAGDKGSAAAKTTANTHRVAALALGGRAKEAAAVCEQGERRIDPGALLVYGISEDWLKKTLRPHFKDYQPAAIARSDLFAGAATAAFAGSAKARPLTAHEHAITADQADAGFKKWLGETFVAAYERAGKHDAKWDTDARALLAGIGEAVIGTPSDASIALAERLLAADCKDPLTLYAVTRTLKEGDANRLVKALTSSLPGLARDQPAVFSWWAASHVSNLGRRIGRGDMGSGLLPEIRKLMLAAAADPVFAGDNRRHYVRCLWGVEEYARAGNDWVTDDVVANLGRKSGVDPWIVHVVTGLHNTRKAKHQKGSERERAGFLRLAAEHLGKAHELCPSWPEAAVGMIVVTSLEQGETSPREWFDRALDAQIDFEAAYRAYVDSLRPRHGGSTDAMYRFAVECLDSGRFDTDIPLWYPWTLQRIQEELKAPREAWAGVGVAERLEKVWKGYTTPARKTPAFLDSGRCVLAWAGGRYDDALAAWHATGKKLDQRWIAVAGVDELDVIQFDLEFLERRNK